MLAIASFYVVPVERLPDIVAAAVRAKSGWFGRVQDNFGPVLRDSGRALDEFARFGWAFNTLDLYLETRHGFMFDRFGDANASHRLTRARGSYWLVLQHPRVVELLSALEAVPSDPGDLEAFLRDEYGTEAVEEQLTAVTSALATLRAWLAEILPGSVGLLSVRDASAPR